MIEQPQPAKPAYVGLLWLLTVSAMLLIVAGVLEKLD
jgi:hypothetical protein